MKVLVQGVVCWEERSGLEGLNWVVGVSLRHTILKLSGNCHRCNSHRSPCMHTMIRTQIRLPAILGPQNRHLRSVINPFPHSRRSSCSRLTQTLLIIPLAMSDRSRRRCVQRRTAVPDATHYVGYVEDEETPEMIMKKFEEMERIKAASKRSSSSVAAADQTAAGPSSSKSAAAAGADDAPAPAGAGQQQADAAAAAAAAPATGDVDAAEEGPLDQQQLQEIFKATSMYNVKSLLANNEALMVDAAANKQQLGNRGLAADIDFDSGTGTAGLLRPVHVYMLLPRSVHSASVCHLALYTLPCTQPCTPAGAPDTSWMQGAGCQSHSQQL